MGSSYRVIGKIGGTPRIGSSKKLSMFLIRSPSPSPSTVCKMEEKSIADPIAEVGAVQPQYVVETPRGRCWLSRSARKQLAQITSDGGRMTLEYDDGTLHLSKAPSAWETGIGDLG